MSLADDLAQLETLDLDGLRAEWRRRFGPPPPLRSTDVMRRCLAEKMQMAEVGEDPELERELARLARDYRRGRNVTSSKPSVAAGVVIVREYAGQTHRVEACADGFVWQGRTWKSLSQIAREITGVRWNGPRFFGLREERAA